jgi:hypothetical protein
MTSVESRSRIDRSFRSPPPAAAPRSNREAAIQPRLGPDALRAAGIAATTWLVALLAWWQKPFFYYVGDNPESFVPLWHHFGESLRAGQWPPMDPAGWMGGNYAAEAATALWNPVSLINFVVVSYFDRLDLAATLVMIEFLGLLAAAVYLLARQYGAQVAPAVAVALAAPFSGFTLWYEAAGWPAGLMAFTWVVWSWWALQRYAVHRTSPLVPFAFGFLTMTTGNPYGALGLVVVVAAVALERLTARAVSDLLRVLAVGAAIGLTAALVFLPLLGAQPVTSRATLAAIANDTFFVPDLGDLAAGSALTYLPSILNWNGALLESLPSAYLVWWAVPLLPWLRGRELLQHRASLVSLVTVAAFYLLATLGPSNLWLFRWPLRLVEYLYVAVLVVLAVMMSAGLARDRLLARSIATAGLVFMGAYLSWAVRPEYWAIHARATLVTTALVAALLIAAYRWGTRGLVTVAVLGTAAAVLAQAAWLPPEGPGDPVYPAYDIEAMSQGSRTYRGITLQVAELSGVTTDQMQNGQLLFGNLPIAPGTASVGRYTGMGFRDFSETLCMDYRGATCDKAFERLWRPPGPGTDIPLVDLMRVETLNLQRSLLTEVDLQSPPDGWQVALSDDVRVVWTRIDPLPYPGRLSGSSVPVDVSSSESAALMETLAYRSGSDTQLTFARLAWPGYSATVDGREVTVGSNAAGLVTVVVPAGEHEFALSYESPGLRVGALLAAAAAAVVVLLAIARRVLLGGRSRERPPERATDPEKGGTR